MESFCFFGVWLESPHPVCKPLRTGLWKTKVKFWGKHACLNSPQVICCGPFSSVAFKNSQKLNIFIHNWGRKVARHSDEPADRKICDATFAVESVLVNAWVEPSRQVASAEWCCSSMSYCFKMEVVRQVWKRKMGSISTSNNKRPLQLSS